MIRIRDAGKCALTHGRNREVAKICLSAKGEKDLRKGQGLNLPFELPQEHRSSQDWWKEQELELSVWLPYRWSTQISKRMVVKAMWVKKERDIAVLVASTRRTIDI